MSIITKMLKMDAVYWPIASTDSGGIARDNYGKPLYSSPMSIKCRWEERVEEFIDKGGDKVLSKAIVYVDRDVALEGILMLGTLDDVVFEDAPKSNADAWEIRRFDKLPDINIRRYLRTAFL